MIDGKRVLAVIPARGGSKGLPGKNIRRVAGKPLLNWTIEAARTSRYIDRLILSTDSEDIASVARESGCEVPFMRPAELAKDDTPGVAPIIHAAQACGDEYDLIVVLQPTSPLRIGADIDQCIEACTKAGAQAAVSVSPVEQHPYWMFRIDDSGRLQALFDNVPARRQELPPVYAINGAVYVIERSMLLHAGTLMPTGTSASVMPKERALDIDSASDLQLAETCLQEKRETA